MPFFSDPNLEDDQNQQMQGGQNIVSGAGGVVTGQGGGQGTSGAAAGPDAKGTKSGSWTNLVSYLDANKGNDAAIGGKIKDSVDAQAAQANDAQQQFQTQANKAINDNQTAANRAVELSKQQPITAYKGGVGKDLAPSYNGPASSDQINEYAAAQQKATGVQNTAKLADQGHEGRIQLLDQNFGRPSYSQGEKNLDSFILGGGQGGAKALSDVSSTYGKYGDQFKSLADSVSGNLAKQSQDAATARQTAQQNLQAKAQEFKSQAAQRMAAENAARQATESNNQFRQKVTAPGVGSGQMNGGDAANFIEQQAKSAYQDLLDRYASGPDDAQNQAMKVALQKFQPEATTWQSTSANEEDLDPSKLGAVDWDLGGGYGRQFYKGPESSQIGDVGTADEIGGYNSLMDYLGLSDRLTDAKSAGRSFDKDAYQQAVMNAAKNRYGI